MIYIIDDKPNRQELIAPYLFTEEYTSVKRINNISELDEVKPSLFNANNIICLHDSFFKNPINTKGLNNNPSDDKRNFESDCSNNGVKLILFSGDFSGVKFSNESFLTIEVNRFYSNLRDALANLKSDNDILRFIAFGRNHKHEEIFFRKHQLVESIAHLNKSNLTNYDAIDDYVTPIYEVLYHEPDDELEKLKDYVDSDFLTNQLLIQLTENQIKQYLK